MGSFQMPFGDRFTSRRAQPQVKIYPLGDAAGLVIAEIEKQSERRLILCRLSTTNFYFSDGSAKIKAHGVLEVLCEMTFSGNVLLDKHGDSKLKPADKKRIERVINCAFEETRGRHPISDFFDKLVGPKTTLLLPNQMITTEKPALTLDLNRVDLRHSCGSGDLLIHGESFKHVGVDLSVQKPFVEGIPSTVSVLEVRIGFCLGITGPTEAAHRGAAEKNANEVLNRHFNFSNADNAQLELPFHKEKK
ncbi:Uncharacterised protein [Candidatus Gugararchaeum adminiculabundum]|nr:Uncharacterised protein [Candidatus Gugararchaeum adminiculabundum]